MDNKRLFFIAVIMIPFVVISFFVNRKEETNFILKENENQDLIAEYIEPSIKLLVDDRIEEINLEDYIIGVVAGEMPASFDDEALKAQAVASRSYALYKKEHTGNTYDLTTNTDTQVYIDIDQMKEKWGTGFDKYYNKIKTAVENTKGEVLTYDGDIIEAFYFSMSSGSTQEASYVFGENRDYLKSVSSEYDNESLKNFEVTKNFSHQEIIDKLNLDCNSIIVNDIKYNDSGYVENITICSKQMTGQNFRTSLGLRSASFKIDIGDIVSITTKGYGHGVGLSQYGANGYALKGYTYDEILKHYYSGVEIINIKSV